ncbi:MAG: hypothetical protein ABSE49_16765 [Polyangiaceae bacterium]|jgi:hypothetical protein
MTTVQNPQPLSSAQQQALYDMMNEAAISNTSGTAATGATTDGSSPPVYLTPQALMVYCQTRLQGIDSQVQTAMTAQQNSDWEQSAIGNILSEIASDSANANGGVLSSASACQTLEGNLESLISQIQQKDPGCSQLGQLEQLHDTIMATGTGPFPAGSSVQGYYCSNGAGVAGQPTGTTPPANVNNSKDNGLGTNELTDFTNTLNNINSSLSSGAELGMINIQSLMSTRTTAIQLTTSILQSYDDGLEKIADKIGT